MGTMCSIYMNYNLIAGYLFFNHFLQLQKHRVPVVHRIQNRIDRQNLKVVSSLVSTHVIRSPWLLLV